MFARGARVGVSAAHPLQEFLLDGSTVGRGSSSSLLSESYPLFVSQSKVAHPQKK